jgi:hypothetical protein
MKGATPARPFAIGRATKISTVDFAGHIKYIFAKFFDSVNGYAINTKSKTG